MKAQPLLLSLKRIITEKFFEFPKNLMEWKMAPLPIIRENHPLESTNKKILIVHAQPQQKTVTWRLNEKTADVLKAPRHQVMKSDLFPMGWKAAFDNHDFPQRINQKRLSFYEETG
ncbi:NAD(P)H-dependent oxidoreductase [Ralstonia solanacearum]|uniref:NAD(P)H-dependent oxidoreductase n=1 Tax=Ralstonia solanacearum TaxID=305 RepID=UPI0011D18421|nr:NAD(P)H-dependent oxidoreductase [Ralstonia solanacearum]